MLCIFLFIYFDIVWNNNDGMWQYLMVDVLMPYTYTQYIYNVDIRWIAIVFVCPLYLCMLVVLSHMNIQLFLLCGNFLQTFPSFNTLFPFFLSVFLRKLTKGERNTNKKIGKTDIKWKKSKNKNKWRKWSGAPCIL